MTSSMIGCRLSRWYDGPGDGSWDDGAGHDACRHSTSPDGRHAGPVGARGDALGPHAHVPQQPHAGYAWHPFRTDGVPAEADAGHGPAAAPRNGAAALPRPTNAW